MSAEKIVRTAPVVRPKDSGALRARAMRKARLSKDEYQQALNYGFFLYRSGKVMSGAVIAVNKRGEAWGPITGPEDLSNLLMDFVVLGKEL